LQNSGADVICGKLRGRRWPTKQISLADVATQILKPLKLALLFDTLGGYRHAKSHAESDDGLDHLVLLVISFE
jgi:hypothetical protein